ncbi:enoyl-CoA hydratase/isomerase family protein [Frigoribacterium sp. VKM Ac-2530]|uniref:enoyl-CoA hydratase/isomerase family protein n=1 Tax=Frigoribacterium sp. VKM Ac-2530 TaxID=2783822 RepID=UPI00188BD55C|nr:enoyl-CoA hydratase/isomerase family protein [Frigoribacterium sp. VKM Ac-2530]MBF4578894.1 enoyl-CoA hydratase/isomerase family protein [Frigoribacterium sp. VKM Ac-2530]
MSADAREPEVMFHVDRGVGVVTLNRPGKINAVTEGMLGLVERALDAWQDDDAVEALLLRGAGPRGFCAGGDITAIHRDATADPARSVAMWRREYRGALRLARWDRPVVSYLDGIAMGAGVGLGGHVSLRVVTPRSRVGMPETLIGLTPDAGGSYLLSRAPGELGTHLALTGVAMTASDALLTGFADVLVADEGEAGGDLVLDALATGGPDAVRALAIEPPPAPLAAERSWIDDAYQGDDARRVLARLRELERDGVAAAGRAADDLEAASPTSVVLTLAAQRRARGLPDLEAVLGQELGLVTALADSPDLVEGIRARVVDKDRSPRWSPARLADVDAAAVLARVDWETRL